jgi:hypothetical protein
MLSTVLLTDADAARDVLCGFQIVDGHHRLVIVEGRADGALHKMMTAILRTAATTSVGIIYNPDITFKSRMYTAFNATLRLIKLRGRVDELLLEPRTAIEPKFSGCFTALMRADEICRAIRMRKVRLR